MTSTFLDLASYCVFPFFQFAVADKLSASVTAMDEDDTHPKFDPQDDSGRNTQEFGDFSDGDVEVSAALDESVEHFFN